MRPCSKCGELFQPPDRGRGGGRKRTRCDTCRPGVHAIDGSKWRKIRLVVLAEEPGCARSGCGRPADTVDHIVPLSAGGDPYDRENLQALCRFHNISKGGTNRPGRRTAQDLKRWTL